MYYPVQLRDYAKTGISKLKTVGKNRYYLCFSVDLEHKTWHTDYVIARNCFGRYTMSVPSSILNWKPTEFGALEIRCIRGFYYVYRVTSKWDPEKRRSK